MSRFTGRGIIFAVLDNEEELPEGARGAKDVLTLAIEEAMSQGLESPKEIASYLTSTAFHEAPDRQARFNAVLYASQAVGSDPAKLLAQWLEAIYFDSFTGDGDAQEFTYSYGQALGFAQAWQIMLNPAEATGGSWESLDPRAVTDLAHRLLDESSDIRERARRMAGVQ